MRLPEQLKQRALARRCRLNEFGVERQHRTMLVTLEEAKLIAQVLYEDPNVEPSLLDVVAQYPSTDLAQDAYVRQVEYFIHEWNKHPPRLWGMTLFCMHPEEESK